MTTENTITDQRAEEEVIAALQQVARAHGAESRAADVVANNVLLSRFRFSPGLGWLEWDGRRWTADDDVAEPNVIEAVRQFIDATEKDYRKRCCTARQRIEAITKAVLGRATDDERMNDKGKPATQAALVEKLGSESERQELADAASDLQEASRQADIWLNLLSAGKISSITKLCRGMKGIITRATEFDAHPDLLNCHNGVVDLRDGTLYRSHPDLLMTHLAGGDYIPGARSKTWDKALQAIHPDLREWFQTRMGQAITGHTPDDDAVIVSEGGGENGKTAVMFGISRAAGTYGRLISHKVLIAQPGQHPTELMDLRGLRFALLEETPEEGRLDTHQLKVTIGTPYITARHMRCNSVTFTTSHTLVVNTNFLPQVDSTDHGSWRRLKAMPWPFRFRKENEPIETQNDRRGDRALKARLHSDPTVPAAVIAYMVEGAKRWYAAGRVSPEDPPMVQEATARWRASSDVGFQFATDRLIADEHSFITAEVMRQEFTAFLAEQGKREWSSQTINTRLPASMEAAGIRITADPKRNAKVRQGDRESRPTDDGWNGIAAPAPAVITSGKQVRMWRGVRFKTDDERAGEHLRAV